MSSPTEIIADIAVFELECTYVSTISISSVTVFCNLLLLSISFTKNSDVAGYSFTVFSLSQINLLVNSAHPSSNIKPGLLLYASLKALWHNNFNSSLIFVSSTFLSISLKSNRCPNSCNMVSMFDIFFILISSRVGLYIPYAFCLNPFNLISLPKCCSIVVLKFLQFTPF